MRYRQGEVEALGEMVEHYRRPLFGFIWRMTEGRDEAEEIFQEVWIRAIRHIPTFRQKRFLSWLFRIAHNLIIDRARKKKPDASLQDVDGTERCLEDSVAGKELDPARSAGYGEMKTKIDEAVARLPDEQKTVFLMRMEGDVPFKDIARIQGTSINTALARMHYALQKLRNELTEEYATLQGDS